MQTVLQGTGGPVVIGPDRPTVLIGERINPTGKPRLTQSLIDGDLSRVLALARSQVADGAHILDINVGAADVDEVELLPQAVKAVQEAVDLPLCIDSANPDALEAALAVYEGRALVNSVNGERAKMAAVLPLVAEHHAAVIALATDDAGIPETGEGRLAVIETIVGEAAKLGIGPERILADCLSLTVASGTSAVASLEAMCLVRERLGLNQTIGASNISFGLPQRERINDAFLSMCLAAGVNAPIVNVRNAMGTIMASDLLLGKDEMAMGYVMWCRGNGR